jgi:predicted RNase H-like HicB family nuclease
MSRKLELTAIYETAENGVCTCFLEEMPTVFSEGASIMEARENLKDAFRMMMVFRHDEAEKRTTPGAQREILDLKLA